MKLPRIDNYNEWEQSDSRPAARTNDDVDRTERSSTERIGDQYIAYHDILIAVSYQLSGLVFGELVLNPLCGEICTV